MYLVVLTNLVALSTMLCVAVNGPAKMPGTALSATLTTLNPPCWLDWLANDALLADARYTPEVWRLTSKNINDFKRKVALHPSKLWLFWNEPEHADQANTPPEIAASLTISYAQALAAGQNVGQSRLLPVVVTFPPGPIANLNGMAPFTVGIPEPSTFALTAIGGAALLLLRRRR